LTELGQRKAFYDLISEIFATGWETTPQTFRDTIVSLTTNPHRKDFITSKVPISEMVYNSTSS
jgi:hypothetical protein